MDWYKLEGKIPVRVEFREMLNSDCSSDRRVALTHVGPIDISTVFLMADHQHEEGPPLLFETMAFSPGMEEQWQERCSTWEEAEAQHWRAVEHFKRLAKDAQQQVPPEAVEPASPDGDTPRS